MEKKSPSKAAETNEKHKQHGKKPHGEVNPGGGHTHGEVNPGAGHTHGEVNPGAGHTHGEGMVAEKKKQ